MTPSTRHALLEILKREGPQDARSLAGKLGITPMAVSLQLAALQGEKLVLPEAAAPGRPRRGRPVQRWGLTEAANRVFPDAHALLTVGLIASLQEAYGSQGVQKLLDVRTRQQSEEYGQAMPKGGTLRKRVEALARLRDREGYMTQVEARPDGALLLIENHCPICTAARTCQGFCSSEWLVFRTLLGPGVAVDREEHILSGGRRCVYTIVPRKASGRKPGAAAGREAK